MTQTVEFPLAVVEWYEVSERDSLGVTGVKGEADVLALSRRNSEQMFIRNVFINSINDLSIFLPNISHSTDWQCWLDCVIYAMFIRSN